MVTGSTPCRAAFCAVEHWPAVDGLEPGPGGRGPTADVCAAGPPPTVQQWRVRDHEQWARQLRQLPDRPGLQRQQQRPDWLLR